LLFFTTSSNNMIYLSVLFCVVLGNLIRGSWRHTNGFGFWNIIKHL
jgi:hypothetical protein